MEKYELVFVVLLLDHNDGQWNNVLGVYASQDAAEEAVAEYEAARMFLDGSNAVILPDSHIIEAPSFVGAAVAAK